MIKLFICLGIFVNCIIVQAISSPKCTIQFSHDEEDIDIPEYVTEEFEANVYFINYTGAVDHQIDNGGEVRNKTKNKPKPKNLEAELPYATFRCSSEYFSEFSFSGVEGLSMVQITRKRDVSKFLSNGTVEQILYVEVILANNATGEYMFASKDDRNIRTTYYIFANTQGPPRLLGQGRTLSGIYKDQNNAVLIPCVSSDPTHRISLWRADDNRQRFAVPVDGKSVKFDKKYGFTILRDWKSKRSVTGKFVCTALGELNEVSVIVKERNTPINSNPGMLTIHMLRNGVAECYGPTGSTVRFYSIDVNYDEAQVLIQCFMNNGSCGHEYHNAESGSPYTDETGALSVQVMDLTEKSGHLYCLTGDTIVHNHYYRALDGNYYLVEETNQGDILRIVFSPEPPSGIFSSGAKVSIGSAAASGIFVDEPRLYYGKYQNGAVSYIGYTSEHKSFFKQVFSRDLVEIIVNDQLIESGQFLNRSRPIKTRKINCGKRQFQCASDECILESQRCDHVVNCADGNSDEINCSIYRRNCTDNEAMCTSGQCIKKINWCNNQTDCFDGSDEFKCFNGCEMEQFKCRNGSCIANSYVCDGDKDCEDGSDESENVCQNCNGDMTKFKCNVGGCIQHSRVCDGFKNCQDGSDETQKACSEFIPKIVNTGGNTYTFGSDEDHYLVCEVKIPATDSPKFTPFVEWDTQLKRKRVSKGLTKRNRFISKPLTKLESNGSETTYFVYPLPSFDVWDEGDYTCRAYNQVGESRRTFTVLASDCDPEAVLPPKPQKPSQSTQSVEHTPAQVVCTSAGKFKDPENCRSFYECLAVGNKFIRHKYSCGHGTVYCAEEEKCGWEHDCPCKKVPDEEASVSKHKPKNKLKVYYLGRLP